jgi:hypothetical protein
MGREHRWRERQTTDLNTLISARPHGLRPARIRNISPSGLFVEMPPSSPLPPLPEGAHVELIFVRAENHITRLLRVPALVVRATREGAGLMFRDINLGAFRALLTQLLAERNTAPHSSWAALEQIRLDALQRLVSAMSQPANGAGAGAAESSSDAPRSNSLWPKSGQDA